MNSSKVEPSETTIKSPSLGKRLRRYFNQWCTQSTVQGLTNIARARSKIVLVIWIISFTISVAYCSYVIISIVLNYLSYQVLINMQVFPTIPTEFPAVTICNLNPLDRRRSQGYIDAVLKRNKLSYVANESLIDIHPTLVLNLLRSSIASDTNLSKEQKRELGFDLNFMFLFCQFNNVPCNQSDFVFFYNYDYTNCFTFNSGFDRDGNRVPKRMISEAGTDKSFKLGLFLGEETTQGEYMTNGGARVCIHNQNVTPILNQEGRDVATNYQTNLGLKRTILNRLDDPYSSCIKNSASPYAFNSDLYQAIFFRLNMTIYRQQVCLRLCLQRHIKETCKCVDGSLPNIYNESVPICASIELLKCATEARIKYFANSNEASCVECPLECESFTYEMSTSVSRFPTGYYTDYLCAKTDILTKFANTTNVTELNIQKNIVIVNVFFRDIATTYVDEMPQVTSDTLFGNIGGNLGLFLGCSALSFVEIIELVIHSGILMIRHVFSKNKKPKQTTSNRLAPAPGNKY